MLEALGWGTLAASSLVIGAILALTLHISIRVIGLIMGFGAGVLISALAFDLVEEGLDMSSSVAPVIVGIFLGCVVFSSGNWAIERKGGGRRKSATGAQRDGSSMAIVLGTVLDGVPESMVIGLTIFRSKGVGAAYLVAVFISNLPEAISSTAGLVASGWTKVRVLRMWILIALVSGGASMLGYAVFQDASSDLIAGVLAFAAGAILTMLADTMMPEAFQHGGRLVGLVTTLGFTVALVIHTVE